MFNAETCGARELDARSGDGLEVRLLWHAGDDRLVVEVVDSLLGDSVTFEVAPGRALEAFRHPYAYAPRRPYRVTRTAQA